MRATLPGSQSLRGRVGLVSRVVSPSTRESPSRGRSAGRAGTRGASPAGRVPIGPFGSRTSTRRSATSTALAVDELDVERREARLAVEAGEARLDASSPASGSGAKKRRSRDAVRVGRPRRAGSRPTSARARRAGSRGWPRRAAPGAARRAARCRARVEHGGRRRSGRCAAAVRYWNAGPWNSVPAAYGSATGAVACRERREAAGAGASAAEAHACRRDGLEAREPRIVAPRARRAASRHARRRCRRPRCAAAPARPGTAASAAPARRGARRPRARSRRAAARARRSTIDIIGSAGTVQVGRWSPSQVSTAGSSDSRSSRGSARRVGRGAGDDAHAEVLAPRRCACRRPTARRRRSRSARARPRRPR